VEGVLLPSANKIVAEERPLKRSATCPTSEPTAPIPEIFAAFRQTYARKFRGFSGPDTLLRCIEAAVNLPFDEGLKIERKLFVELHGDAQSAAQRTPSSPSARPTKIPDVPGTPR